MSVLIDNPSLTLLELFLCGVGGSKMRINLALTDRVMEELQEDDLIPFWSVIFNQALDVLAQLVYPVKM